MSAAEAESHAAASDSHSAGNGGHASARRSPASDMRMRFMTETKAKIEDVYDIERRPIARGGYGAVFRAISKDTKMVTAVKSMLKDRVKDVPTLDKEIEVTKTMDHPNIVKLFASFQDEKYIYVVMELCEGGELLQRIVEAKRLAEPLVKLVMEQMLRAICYMHGKGIVHRDVKPENFLLLTKEPLEKNTLKLIDFGLSKHISDGEQLEAVVGSAFYVAPEVLAKSYGKASDLWSCGAILYMMLSGQPPFTGMSDNQVLQKVKKGEYRLIGRLWEPVSEQAKDLIRNLLLVDPDARWTAEQALDCEWMRDDAASGNGGELHPDLIQNLRGYCSASRFKKAALVAVAHQLREDEVENLRTAFKSIDQEGKGHITHEQLRRSLLAVPGVVQEPELLRIMSEVDINADGTLSYTEFLAAAMDQQLLDNEDFSWRAFKAFDLNNDGAITVSELRHVMEDDEPLSPKFASTFDKFDRSGKGSVTYAEFQQMLKADADLTQAQEQ